MAKRKQKPPPVELLTPSLLLHQTADETGAEPHPGTRRLRLYAVLLVVFVLLIYALRLDRTVGVYVDDAWYVLLGQALATGHGYRLTNSPSPGILPFYPPGYPFLLSLVFRLVPQFPQNLLFLKAVSCLAMFGLGGAVYVYFRRVRVVAPLVALGLASVVVLNPALVFLATSTTMSECVFMFWQVLTVLAVERCVSAKQEADALRWAGAAAVLGAAMFLTRAASIAVLLATVLYLTKERRWRPLAVFALTSALLLGPWMLYTGRNAVTPEQKAEQNNYIVYRYSESFWHRRAGYPNQGILSLEDIPGRMFENGAHILDYDVGALFVDPLFRALVIGDWRLKSTFFTSALSYLLSLLAGLGFVLAWRARLTLAELAVPLTLLVTLAWPFPPIRFLLPLLPWMAYYLLLGCESVWRKVAQLRLAPLKLAYGVLAVLLALNLYGTVTHIVAVHRTGPNRAQWLRIFDENEALIKWAGDNLPTNEVIATQNPGMVALYTGRKTIGSLEPARNWELWKRLGVRYWLQTSYYKQEPLKPAEKRYRVLHTTPELDLRVLDFGAADTRLPWQETP
ncbi:MAG: hypothetical protein HYR56_19060 [Acidobacteria bacterium]|nr:hypothetical protein [Acidobacteriota bacterium]MBI3426727.1 hypothetical protein [Acidobacteriota bacterium]